MPDTPPVDEAERAARPEAYNLLGIYAALDGRAVEAVTAEFAGAGFGDFKAALTDLAVAVLGPIGTEMQRLMADPAEIDGILHDGAERAATLAEPILREVYDIVGLLKP
jgi:tryptophanyl-tRNA synthetase